MIKGYIFDLDGTLLDSLNVWDNVGNRYLQSIGIQGPDDLDSLMEHMSLQEAALYMKNTFVLTQSVNEVALGITYIIEEAYEKSIPLKIGARKVIEKCFDRNYQIVAFTAGSVELATKALMRLNLFHYFQNIYSCQTCGYNKTEIESYLTLVKSMNLKVKECVVVEDALYAIETAVNAGCYVKAIYDQANQKDWDKICGIAHEHYESFIEMEDRI